MKYSAKRFFSAMGSILDICPASTYSEYRSSSSDLESISSDWKIVGGYLSGAIADNEPKKTAKKINSKRAYQTC